MPPTFLTAAEFAVLPHVIGDPELALDFRKVVHGSQEYEFHRPLRVGETLTVQRTHRVDPAEGRQRVPRHRDADERHRR